MNYWKVSGLRVSYDGVVSVDQADDGLVEDVTLQEQGGLDGLTAQYISTNNQSTPWKSDHTNGFCGEILVFFCIGTFVS